MSDLFLVIFHFAVPFVILLSRPFKRDITQAGLAGGLAAAHAIRGPVLDHRAEFFRDIQRDLGRTCVIPFAMGGLWLAYFFRNLSSMPLLPRI